MLQNNKILLVEDSDTDRYLFSKYLNQLGYECDCFENGQELIENIGNYPSSLVLMDIELPVMNGIETAIHVRKHFHDQERKFILIGLTSHNDPEKLDEIAASGFDYCLHKPLKRLELEQKLKLYISTSMNTPNPSPNSGGNGKPSPRSYSLEMFEADDPEFLESIVGMFVASTPVAIETLKQAFANREWEALRMSAHKLKPHFNYFMVTDGAKALQEVEELARHSQGEDIIPDLLFLIEEKGKLVVQQMKEDFNQD
ncbi:MAG: response regulator [Bacteroidales bacterium]|nr:response regulator [Bacteroidales bacterium]